MAKWAKSAGELFLPELAAEDDALGEADVVDELAAFGSKFCTWLSVKPVKKTDHTVAPPPD